MGIAGTIFQVQRFSVDDGPGIRTTVFLKGCPLRCIWCHNPESFSPLPQLRWREDKCVRCGRCALACPEGLHEPEQGGRLLHGERCLHCGKCAAACPTGALELLGYRAEAEDIIGEAVRDRPYYEQSGGGLTISGGEPTCQPEFLLELLRLAKQEGLHTCVETCGFAPWRIFQQLLPLTDLFLFDYKATGEENYRKFTGVSGQLILENLDRLSKAGASILLRCPIIPGYNDSEEHFACIRQIVREKKGVLGAEVMPYHNMGAVKWKDLGLPYTLGEMPSASDAERTKWQNMVKEAETL